MVETDKKRFAQAFAAMAATYDVEASREMTQGYWLGLKDVPIEQVEFGFLQAIQKCRYKPSVAEIRELAGVLSDDDAAVVAWDSFQKAVSDHGVYATVDFEDKLINATVRNMGGWIRLCGLDPEEFDKWAKKEFLKTYASLRRSGVKGSVAPLGGLHDRQNASLGYDRKEQPAMIPHAVPERLRIASEQSQ